MPLLVKIKTPPLVPAKIFESLAAREKVMVFVKAELINFQLTPLLVEIKIPPLVPAMIFFPLTARD